MKILLAMSYFLYPSSNGGAQMCRRVAEGLRRAGHEVVVSCIDFSAQRGQGYITRWVEQDGFRVFSIVPPEMPAGRVVPLWRARPRPELSSIVTKLLEEVRPDLVYVNASMEIPDFSLVPPTLGIPVVFHVHDFGHLCSRQFLLDGWGRMCSGPESVGKCVNCLAAERRLPRRILERYSNVPVLVSLTRILLGEERASSFRAHEAVAGLFAFTKSLHHSVAAYVVTAETIADIEVKYGAPREKIHILPHFLPDDRLERAGKVARPAGSRTVIGFFGRLSREKGFNILAEALKRLEVRCPDSFDLVVISNGATPEAVSASLGGELPADRIRIYSDLTGPALNPVLANLDVCVIPSLCVEIGPLTLLEAIAQGTPCIVSEAVGMKSLIADGINGRLVTAGCVEALEQSLRSIILTPEILAGWRCNLPEIMGGEEYIGNLGSIFCQVFEGGG